MAQDINHVAEHLKEKIDLKKELSTEEIEFFYFMEHDFNNDSRLDGLEILSAIKHSDFAKDLKIDSQSMNRDKMREAFDMEIKYYTDIIDEILKEDDFNNDGYLSYIEYSLARRRDEIEDEKERIKKSKV
ncbi:multiple coagulation factor deficiency 2 -like protein [Brachionus plicatilis]|uniref:Multiple coagulation factor deficiency 2-like protein n=1 Tax=Brachionus plicatilis TaxID=10195 RepID=A0A3M7R1U3_BRAPC|nr:multiple coagulation factor deficiency 2 -like protein [Brachionus plicatilis]